MSLFNQAEQKDSHHTGRVILGMDTPGPNEMTVQEMEGKKKLVWDDSMSDEFMTRVRTKAQLKAKEILEQAMEEAKQIRASAHEAGVSQGLSSGQQQLEEHLQNISTGLEQVIESIQSQADVVWEARRQDFVKLIRMAVEKVIGIEMAQQRVQMLDFLLDQSVARLESDRVFMIRTNPEDAETLDELLARVQAENPKLTKWIIKPDPSITAGVIIETSDAKVENTTDGRWEGVATILDQLTVYGPDAMNEQQA